MYLIGKPIVFSINTFPVSNPYEPHVLLREVKVYTFLLLSHSHYTKERPLFSVSRVMDLRNLYLTN